MNTSVATITAQYVNPPQAGKKRGSIKTPQGQYYGVRPEMLGQFQPGGTYEVEYSTSMFNGKPYMNITSIRNSAVPVGQTAPVQTMGGGMGAPRRQDSSEQIFVTALLKSFIEAGEIKPNAGDLKKAIQSLRAVYAETFGGQPPAVMPQAAPKPRDDMDDSIPF